MIGWLRRLLECHCLAQLRADFVELKEFLMATQSEVAQTLTDLTAQVAKIGDETRTLLDRIADLQEAVDNAGSVDPAVLDALAALQAQVTVVDDLVPDSAPEEPEQPE